MKPKTSKWLAANGMRPAPIYEGHFSDGTVLRMSFWSPKGKPYDFEAGRNLMKPGVRLRVCTGYYLPAHLEGKELVDGFVEHDVAHKPWVRLRDPLFAGEALPETPQRKTVKQARDIILKLVRHGNGNIPPELVETAMKFAA